ncbi:Asp-tRNA(Asn)/Glu-tRNA(Gln) amidotransferase subunit GatB [Candidatus Falkowbacteria bacterium]|nr:Asp-tRNA(Asn)/Glu-tRNA(Gln) amidotransferase subunit GatB [Candidatus Falkowbacteria bacterium]
MKLQTLIGLEFHVQLKTKTKMFCACLNNSENEKPNENICPICLGHPGVLPVVNEEAVRMALKAALALNCEIAEFSKFDRKNYFYPDLPKGYQISQFDEPVATDGYLAINNVARDGLSAPLNDASQLKRIGIIRLHLEEDAAKSIHEKNKSLIDFNRGGAPLVEIVTAPHFSSPYEAKSFGQELQLIMRFLEISDADMEKGQMRCDANISLRPEGDANLYPKTEIKNINSFRALERALAFEIKRQTELWLDGKPPQTQETRGWDDQKQQTVSQRSKEESSDYRYFPEPDLPPLTFTKKDIDAVRAHLPELPQAKRQRFVEMYSLNYEEVKILTATKDSADYVEKIISELQEWLCSTAEGTKEEIWARHSKRAVKSAAGWLINKFLKLLDEQNIAFNENKVTSENFAEFITLVYQNKINSAAGQIILEEMVRTGADPSQVMEEKDLKQVDNEADLAKIILKIIKNSPEQVEQFKNGKEAVIKYFIGLVMKETKGKSDPRKAEEILRVHLVK